MFTTTHRLGELIENFLLYAKIEAGAMNIERHPTSGSELAQELRTLAPSLIDGSEVRFSVDVQDGVGGLATDVAKVRAILRNLIHNAIKFTSHGEISVRVERRDDEFRFAVRDTGIGIVRENHEKIFEPFRQLDGSLSRSHGGVGLGLALSRKLARLLGGDIEVDGKPGIGSTFTLRLPASDETVRKAARRHDRSHSLANTEAGRTLAA
jgi:signal transduction histidine kinase